MPTSTPPRRSARLTPWACCAITMLGSLVVSGTAHAQQSAQEWLEQCRRGNANRVTHCEIRESTLPATSALAINARPNGGIEVRAWDRDEVRVVAKVQAHAPTEAEARQIASQVRVDARAGQVSSDGPRALNNRGWSVSYDVFVPRRIDLTLSGTNGGLGVEEVEGRMNLTTTNGGISIRGAAGEVRGITTNGGIDVRLSGGSWRGAGLDLRTTNGGVTLHAPANYSARVTARTTNGGINTEFPMTVQGRIGRSLEGEIGQGGALLNITTTNGGIRLMRI
jgi:DUF4097 and DUF4098 domain-containing protein YvlB